MVFQSLGAIKGDTKEEGPKIPTAALIHLHLGVDQKSETTEWLVWH